MKVLQVNKFYPPWIGGIETVVQNIAEGLNDKIEMSVLVCQPKGKTISETYKGVRVVRAGSLGTYFSMPISFSFFRYFYKMSKEADIVHLHMPFPLGDLACLLLRSKAKIVVWWHSDIVKQKKLMLLYRPIMNALLKRADSIIVATQGHIDGSKYLKPYKGKCKIMPYGIDVSSYIDGKKRRSILTENLHDKSNKKILFVGRLVYYKGVDILLRAFRDIVHGELFIVGQGELEDTLKENVKSFGITDKVHFLGTLNDEDLKSAFADCDIFAFPSTANSEAFGLVQLEAMVYGKPVINTSLPTGVPYVSINNISGITVPPGSVKELHTAMQKLIDDDLLRTKFGKEAYNRVCNVFNITSTLDSVYEEYKNLIK
jgi:rhamnosyl/mannosyltransferase